MSDAQDDYYERADLATADATIRALRAQVEELTRERDEALKYEAAEHADLLIEVEETKRLTEWLDAAVRGLEEALALEDINREREKRGLPFIYNPTVLKAALAAARGEEEAKPAQENHRMDVLVQGSSMECGLCGEPWPCSAARGEERK